MKTLIIGLTAILGFGGDISAREENIERLRKTDFRTLQTLNMSAQSYLSYEDAMNRFSKIKPDGYVIENIQYTRSGRMYAVLVRLRKIN